MSGYPGGGDWVRTVSKAPVHCWVCDSDFLGDGTPTCLLCGWTGFLTGQGEQLHPQKQAELDQIRSQQQ